MSTLEWTTMYRQSSLLSESDGAGDEYEKTYFSMYALSFTVIFSAFVYAFEFVLDKRQAKAYKKTDFPSELKMTVSKIDAEKKSAKDNGKKEETEKSGEDEQKPKIDRLRPLLPQLEEKFEKAQLYGTDKIKFSMFSSTFNTIVALGALLGGNVPFLWDICTSFGGRFGWTETANEIKISVIFFILVTLIDIVISLPLTWVSWNTHLGYCLSTSCYFYFCSPNFRCVSPSCINDDSTLLFTLKKSTDSTNKHQLYLCLIK